MIILIISNLILYLVFSRLLIPRYNEKLYFTIFINNLKKYSKYLFLIGIIVSFHLIEVNILDKIITDWIGIDFANNIQNIEGDFVYSFSNLWNIFFVYFFVIIYILIYPFTLWFSLYYYILTNNKKSIVNFTYGSIIIYLTALPFYLLFPVTNVYKFYNLDSTLNSVIPNIEHFFYFTTTQNNCLPSLHVAMSILIAWSSLSIKNKFYSYFLILSMILVIISVLYLTIHWFLDVLFGIIIAILTILILKRSIKVE
jgi:membrane-associated phospholipid phosphatase